MRDSIVSTAETIGRWADDLTRAIATRRSHRTYTPERASEEQLARMQELCEGCQPWPDARTVLVPDPGFDVFKGIVGSYGKVTGAPHLLVMVGPADKRLDQRAGYTGEAAVLLAETLGLGTCWVGGYFDTALAERLTPVSADERIVAVSPLGISVSTPSANDIAMRGLARAKKRRPAEKIAPGCEAWPRWARNAAEACVVAPSAMNRQPWRFAMDGDALVLSADNHFETPKVTKRLDIGIAMLHAELGARSAGVTGQWQERADAGLEVARFVPGDAQRL